MCECVGVWVRNVPALVFGAALVMSSGCGKEAAPAGSREARLVAQLKATKPQDRVAAAEELGRIRHEGATDALIRALWDIRGDVRVAAAEALGEIGAEKAAPTLAELTKAKDWRSRRAAVVALGKIGSADGVPSLVHALGDESEAVAMVAGRSLGTSGMKGGEALLAAVKHEKELARRAVALGLGLTRHPGAAEALKGLVKDRDPATRLEAVGAVYKLEGTNALPILAEMLTDESGAVRQEVGKRIASSGKAAVPLLVAKTSAKDGKIRDAAYRALARCWSDEAVLALLPALRERDATVRALAESTISRRAKRPHYRKLLIGALGHDDPRIRLTAMQQLQKNPGPDLLEPAVKLLQDADANVRLTAATIVQEQGDAGAMKHLTPLIDDKDFRVQQVAAAALVKLGDKGAIDKLLEAVKSDKTERRQLATSAKLLGEAKESRAVEPLIKLLLHKDAAVAKETAVALGKIGEKRALKPLQEAYAKAHWQVARTMTQAIGQIGGEEAYQMLMKMMNDAVARVKGGENAPLWDRYNAMTPFIGGLGETRDERLLDFLIPKLFVKSGAISDDPVAMGRSRAITGCTRGIIKALAKIDGDRAYKAMADKARFSVKADNKYERWGRREMVWSLAKMKDKDKAVATMITILENELDHNAGEIVVYCQALGKTGDKRAVKPLVDRLVADIPEVRKAAGEALIELGSVAVNALIGLLDEKSARKRSVTALILGQIGEPAVEPLAKALKEGTDATKQGSAWALGEIGSEPCVEALLEALGDKNRYVRGAAGWALGRCGKEEAVVPLIGLLKDAEAQPRQAAAEGLGMIGDERGIDPLIVAFADPEADVRTAASEAIVKIGGEEVIAKLKALLSSDNPHIKSAAGRAMMSLRD